MLIARLISAPYRVAVAMELVLLNILEIHQLCQWPIKRAFVMMAGTDIYAINNILQMLQDKVPLRSQVYAGAVHQVERSMETLPRIGAQTPSLTRAMKDHPGGW